MNLSKEQRQHAEEALSRLRDQVFIVGRHPEPLDFIETFTSSGFAHSIGITRAGNAPMCDLVSLLATIAKQKVGEGRVRGVIQKCFLTAFSAHGWSYDGRQAVRVEDFIARFKEVDSFGGGPLVFLLPMMGMLSEREAGGFKLLNLAVVSPTIDGVRLGLKLLDRDPALFERYAIDGPDRDWWLQSLRSIDGVCLVQASGEVEAAFAGAKSIARNHLGVINLLLARAGCSPCRLTLLDEDAEKAGPVIYFGESRGFGNTSIGENRAPNGGRLKLLVHNPHLTTTLASADIVGVDRLFDAVAAGSATKYEQQLARMWIWLGRSHMTNDVSEKLLNAIIGLEAGLCTAEEEKISKSLGDHTSILLHEDPEERLAMQKRVRGWYSRRSGIVHTGGDHLSKTDASQALQTALKVADRLTRNRVRWPKVEVLRQELSEALLGKRHSWS